MVAVALTATVYTIDLDLVDHDRGVYDTLALRLARHPSESEDYFVTRLLAYALEYTSGIAFSDGGLSAPDEPAIVVRDLTGTVRSWIEVGWPDAPRLHKAAKAASRVVVYPHRDVGPWLRRLEGARMHRAEATEVRAIDRSLIEGLAAHLDRRLAATITIAEQELFVAIGDQTLTGRIVGHALA